MAFFVFEFEERSKLVYGYGFEAIAVLHCECNDWVEVKISENNNKVLQ